MTRYDPTAPLVVGVDAGGTTTRCVAATVDGHVLGRGSAGGANQRSSGGEPADALAAALRDALSELDPSRVVHGVVGIAGAGPTGRVAAQRSAELAWRRAGVGGTPDVVGDLIVAFAAGTPSGTGSLLLAGTGAVAAAFVDGRLAHRVDGYGWLLGDEGSAVWLGRLGLRAVLAALDGREQATALTDLVAGELLGGGSTESPGGGAAESPGGGAAESPGGGAAELSGEALAQALLGAAFALPPAEFGRFAPLVARAARAGDPVARRIVEDGTARLLHALGTVISFAPGGPVVVAGSLLLTDGPIRDGVCGGVRRRYSVDPRPARDGAAGAAALAIARLTDRAVLADVHARLTGE